MEPNLIHLQLFTGHTVEHKATNLIQNDNWHRKKVHQYNTVTSDSKYVRALMYADMSMVTF